MKNISLLGSTGSIGRQTLDVVAANPDRLRVRALAAHRNYELMLEQIRKFHPDLAVMQDEDAALELKKAYSGPCEIMSGEDGLIAAATFEETDTMVGAMVGYAGLEPTMAAIRCGKDIALANKETLVAAGRLVMDAVAENRVSLTPIDSEHSAIFQSLRCGGKKEVKKILLTASGGPFRGKTKKDLENVTVDQCLHHPNWKMGPKITIDSSTLANKGLEVIEAHWLFNVPYKDIQVLIHPQSILHSAVEFVDGAVIGQMGTADMRLPIQYALSYPERFDCMFSQLDLIKAGTLTFEAPDRETFPLLDLAVACAQSGGTLPCAFNAANEESVYAFLDGKIRYLDIAETVKRAVHEHKNVSRPSIEAIKECDRTSRVEARKIIEKLSI